MREFFIQNQYGQQIQLQGGSVFLYEPSGLGYEDNVDYIGTDGFFFETYREQAQLEKTGTLIFKPPNAYTDYQSFMSWVLLASKITLAYKPVADWYYIDVNVTRVEKTELTIYQTLEVPIVFQPLTPWYSPYDLNLVATGDDPAETKTYAYTYPYRYTDESRIGELTFSLDAQIPSAFSFTLPGYIEEPLITITRADTGETLGVIDFTSITVESGETLVYSNVPGQAGAYMRTASGNVDLTSEIGLSVGVPAFFNLPPKVPLKVVTTGSSTQSVSLYLKVYRYYRTV